MEKEVAAILRKKLGARVTRDKQSGAGTLKQDIRDWHSDTPFSIEAKDHKTLAVKQWMRQAIEAASFHQIPTLVFRSDDEILACVRFADLVNLAVEIRDLQVQLDDLRRPPAIDPPQLQPNQGVLIKLREQAQSKIDRGVKTDREGHITDGYGYCNQKGCKFNRSYKAPKARKT